MKMQHQLSLRHVSFRQIDGKAIARFMARLSFFALAVFVALTVGIGCASDEHVPQPKSKSTVVIEPEKQEPPELTDRSTPAPTPPEVKHEPKEVGKRDRKIGVAQGVESGVPMGIDGGYAGVGARQTPSLGTATGAWLGGITTRSNDEYASNHNTEGYNFIEENRFHSAKENALSTFSIDVDKASYSNVRRFLNYGSLPQKDAVRIEELINYFTYTYPQPSNKHPFSITTEVSECPWNPKHQLVHIGLQGKRMATKNLPPSNLTFLIDVSGSMNTPERLPLVKESMKLLVDELREEDRVSIVVYAGAAGLVLPPTHGNHKRKITDALERLQAGGSTAGGAGIELAYKVAQENFVKNGNNRVILCTDGDFNVGVSSDAELIRLIEQKRKTGIYLTVLGYGMGNYKDSKMEQLADKGNGNYAYIDNLQEAKKTLVSEFGGTLFTIAKDVKIQVEFNPAKVKSYRLIGYENRKLNQEDFNDDKKDAGEIGAGHSVTALYEVVPVGVEGDEHATIDELKYQTGTLKETATNSDEMMTVKFRYKKPDSETSAYLDVPVLESQVVKLEKTSDDFRFAAAVAMFGMLLRDSEHKGDATYDGAFALAKKALGADEESYRKDFLEMIRKAKSLANPVAEHTPLRD
ncbi:MAG: VWA domain-containing protein [Chloroherpetonaceae bacterium]